MEIFAHRGIHSEDVLENSRDALMRMHDSKASGVEIDIRLTRDGVCVLNHGTKTLSKVRISRTNYEELKDNHPELINIEEAMDILRGYNGTINLEIKHIIGERDKNLGKTCLSVLANNRKKFFRDLEPQLLISSFSRENLKASVDMFPEIPRALLVTGLVSDKKAIKKALELECDAIHFSLGQALKRDFEQSVDSIKERGIKSRVFTVNLENDIKKIMQAKVDGIFTDDTELAHRVTGSKE